MKYTRPFFVLLLLLVCFSLTGTVYADNSLPYETDSAVNPLYSGYQMEEETEAPVLFSSGTEEPAYEDYARTLSEVGDQLRQGLVKRESTVTAYYALDTYLAKEDMSEIFASAFYETDQPNEGDYLKWSWQRYNVVFGGVRLNEVNYYTITFTVLYYTTAQEEAVVTEKIDEILTSFDFDQWDTDYVKIKKVYDYICSNVTYDHDGYSTLTDSDTTNNDYTAVTAHKALTQGTAVCQGYATLFYRMVETLDIDTRLIAGLSRNQTHAWNIVKIGDYYFNLDSTWDAGQAEYQYFLRSPSVFASGHTRYSEYSTADFHAQYPMGLDYTVIDCDRYGHRFDSTVTSPTCTVRGFTTYSCRSCRHSYVSDYTDMKPHSFTDYVSDHNATCLEDGTKTAVCDYCTETDTVADSGTVLSHSWDDGRITKSVSSTVSGEITYTCTECGKTKAEDLPATGPCDRDADCVSHEFADAADHWGHDAIDYVVYNGLMNGTDLGFEPETIMSRAMLVTVLYRYAGQPEPGTNHFVDVPEDTWYTDAVSWAVNNGVVTGTGDGSTFSPEMPVSREQLATILYRYADSMEVDTSAKTDLAGYPDADKVASWSFDAMKWAVAKGIISGADRNGEIFLDPGAGANRAVVATIMMRFIQNVLE